MLTQQKFNATIQKMLETRRTSRRRHQVVEASESLQRWLDTHGKKPGYDAAANHVRAAIAALPKRT